MGAAVAQVPANPLRKVVAKKASGGAASTQPAVKPKIVKSKNVNLIPRQPEAQPASGPAEGMELLVTCMTQMMTKFDNLGSQMVKVAEEAQLRHASAPQREEFPMVLETGSRLTSTPKTSRRPIVHFTSGRSKGRLMDNEEDVALHTDEQVSQ